MIVIAAVVVSPLTAHAQSYIERFISWSKDGSFYAITEAGTDDLGVRLCA